MWLWGERRPGIGEGSSGQADSDPVGGAHLPGEAEEEVDEDAAHVSVAE